MLEDENVAANIFIEPNDGGVTDEDSGEEDGGGFLSNLSGKQLNAPAELSFLPKNVVRRKHLLIHPKLLAVQLHNQILPTASLSQMKAKGFERLATKLRNGKKNTSFPEKNMPFPEADYSKYRDFSSAELFELFFDNDLFDLLVQQSILYAHSKGETNFFVTTSEMKVLLGICWCLDYALFPLEDSFGK